LFNKNCFGKEVVRCEGFTGRFANDRLDKCHGHFRARFPAFAGGENVRIFYCDYDKFGVPVKGGGEVMKDLPVNTIALVLLAALAIWLIGSAIAPNVQTRGTNMGTAISSTKIDTSSGSATLQQP
jgi:hypothetical protein